MTGPVQGIDRKICIASHSEGRAHSDIDPFRFRPFSSPFFKIIRSSLPVALDQSKGL
jgi:hypothetical protein